MAFASVVRIDELAGRPVVTSHARPLHVPRWLETPLAGAKRVVVGLAWASHHQGVQRGCLVGAEHQRVCCSFSARLVL